MYVRNLDEFNDEKGTFRAQITFRQQWNDPRLSYSGKPQTEYIPITDSSLIWTPDLFFTNALEGSVHKVLSNNQLMRLYPNGDVLFSSRITLKLRCDRSFSMFPFDKSTCGIKVASYAYTNDEVLVHWKTENPVQVSDKLAVPGLSISNWTTSNSSSTTNTGTYGYIEVHFDVCRQANHWYIIVYIPCSMLVIISYLAFWIKDKNTRYIVALAVLLIGAVVISNVNLASLPKTSYTKALDVWTGMSLTFMMATLVILVIIENQGNENVESDECLIEGKAATSSTNRRQCQGTTRAEKLARTFYPVVFGVWVVVYFSVYCLLRML
jgi:hypothetical protein